jgi:Kef-type K+ transport system membrane component KefB
MILAAELSFNTVLAVAVIALLAPLIVQLAPVLRLPAVVLEIVLGIVVGPSGLDWFSIDVPTNVLALFGLGFLLFLAGLEIDPHRLRHGAGRVAGAYGVSLVLALGVGAVVALVGETSSPLFVAVALSSTSLGLVAPVLSDAGETDSDFGQLVLAGSSVGEFASIVLVSLFFSRTSSGFGATVFLLVTFSLLATAIGVALTEVGQSMRVSGTFMKLEETSAQLGVRVAVALLAVFFVLSTALGLEAILGAFVAGALLRIVDPDRRLIHDRFRSKVEAIGYGFLVPVFFVTSGLRFDADALFESPQHFLLVPFFLLALLLVRGLPALLYRPLVGTRKSHAAGLLQATSLTFLVITAHLGRELDVFDAATAAALLTAGLLSVVIYPPVALALLGDRG